MFVFFFTIVDSLNINYNNKLPMNTIKKHFFPLKRVIIPSINHKIIKLRTFKFFYLFIFFDVPEPGQIMFQDPATFDMR
jgi:hypothetical protein